MSILIEQFFRFVASHPGFEDLAVLVIAAGIRYRHLMRAPETLDFLAIDLFRSSPALGAAQDDHRPLRTFAMPSRASRLFLNGMDPIEHTVERLGHRLMHGDRLMAFDKERFVAVAGEEVPQLLVIHAAEDRRVGDLVAIEMKDWQHCTVRGRV